MPLIEDDICCLLNPWCQSWPADQIAKWCPVSDGKDNGCMVLFRCVGDSFDLHPAELSAGSGCLSTFKLAHRHKIDRSASEGVFSPGLTRVLGISAESNTLPGMCCEKLEGRSREEKC